MTEKAAGGLLVAGFLALLATPIATLAGWLPRSEPPTWVAVLGTVVAVIGFALTVVAQLEMGSSWRVGVDTEEATALVTGGLFSVVRNPIFSAVGLFAVGCFLLVPCGLSVLGLLLGGLGLEIQVRRVEEPILLRHHGKAYADYASRVGRFLPWVGRWPAG